VVTVFNVGQHVLKIFGIISVKPYTFFVYIFGI